MFEWLVVICLFPLLISTFLGGWPLDVEGGSGLRQVGGVVLAYVAFVLVWWVLRLALGGSGAFLGRMLIPTAVTVLLLPVTTMLTLKIMGVRIRFGAGAH